MDERENATRAESKAHCAAAVLARDPRVQLVYLFGSAADASVARPRDIDIAVLTNPALSLEEQLLLRAELVTAGAPGVDLVSLNDAPVVLAHEVAEHGVCLFARTLDDEIDFVTRARARFWDFQPYLAVQWKLAGERAQARRDGAQT